MARGRRRARARVRASTLPRGDRVREPRRRARRGGEPPPRHRDQLQARDTALVDALGRRRSPTATGSWPRARTSSPERRRRCRRAARRGRRLGRRSDRAVGRRAAARHARGRRASRPVVGLAGGARDGCHEPRGARRPRSARRVPQAIRLRRRRDDLRRRQLARAAAARNAGAARALVEEWGDATRGRVARLDRAAARGRRPARARRPRRPAGRGDRRRLDDGQSLQARGGRARRAARRDRDRRAPTSRPTATCSKGWPPRTGASSRLFEGEPPLDGERRPASASRTSPTARASSRTWRG